MAHRFVKIVGMCDPKSETVKIECKCGEICEGRSFASAASKFEAHKNPAKYNVSF